MDTSRAQFFHQTQSPIFLLEGEGRYTVAVCVPKKEELDQYEPGQEYNFFASYSIVSKKDRYIRKVGKEICLGRLTRMPFSLVEIIHKREGKYYVFDSGSVNFVIFLKRGNVKPFLIQASIFNPV